MNTIEEITKILVRTLSIFFILNKKKLIKTVIYFFLIFFLTNPSVGQEIFVKKVTGKVEFITDKEKIVVKSNSSYSDKSGMFVSTDKNSKLIVRINGRPDILFFSKDKNKYFFNELIVPVQVLEQEDKGFWDRWFSIFSIEYNEEEKINGMIVADKSMVSRTIFDDTNIITINTINTLDGYPIKLDFTRLMNTNKLSNNEFNVLIKEKHGRILLDKTINDTYISLDNIEHNSLFLDVDLEINNINSSKKIKGSIKSLNIESPQRKFIDELREKAIAESKTDDSVYQLIFIESLRLKGLYANALFYIDFFIEINNHPKLVNYKDYFLDSN